MITIGRRGVIIGAALLAAAFGHAVPATAQAMRTWVSGVGDDANPCSRTAPCKTFAGSISKTAAGGEINCIDPGAYGSVTITKAIAIVCDGMEAGVLAPVASTGITVKAGEGDAVLLSGLDFEGAGTGLVGVRFVSGRVLHIRNATVRMFADPKGAGVSNETTTASTLIVTGSTISDNSTGVRGTGPGSTIVDDSIISGNATGLSADGGAKILSVGDTILVANGKDGAFTGKFIAR
jgi:hypothetical protein